MAGIAARDLARCSLARPDEQHELGLIVFGLALRQHGWRITYLGANTPIDTLAAAVEELSPAATVLVALTADKLDPLHERLSELARRTRLALAGASEQLAAEIGAELLRGDPVDAAAELVSAPFESAARGT